MNFRVLSFIGDDKGPIWGILAGVVVSDDVEIRLEDGAHVAIEGPSFLFCFRERRLLLVESLRREDFEDLTDLGCFFDLTEVARFMIICEQLMLLWLICGIRLVKELEGEGWVVVSW